jgi:hypothetical protein
MMRRLSNGFGASGIQPNKKSRPHQDGYKCSARDFVSPNLSGHILQGACLEVATVGSRPRLAAGYYPAFLMQYLLYVFLVLSQFNI